MLCIYASFYHCEACTPHRALLDEIPRNWFTGEAFHLAKHAPAGAC